jgi:N-carbamoyl-L-amino-acid hydrolase
MGLTPRRTVDELRELQELTGDEHGAQRVAWTETWERAREWLRGKLEGLGLDEEIDEAGNQWFTLRGDSERALLLGGRGGRPLRPLAVRLLGGRRLDDRSGRAAAAA